MTLSLELYHHSKQFGRNYSKMQYLSFILYFLFFFFFFFILYFFNRHLVLFTKSQELYLGIFLNCCFKTKYKHVKSQKITIKQILKDYYFN